MHRSLFKIHNLPNAFLSTVDRYTAHLSHSHVSETYVQIIFRIVLYGLWNPHVFHFLIRILFYSIGIRNDPYKNIPIYQRSSMFLLTGALFPNVCCYFAQLASEIPALPNPNRIVLAAAMARALNTFGHGVPAFLFCFRRCGLQLFLARDATCPKSSSCGGVLPDAGVEGVRSSS